MGHRLCNIVPAVPPELNGLGDYCHQLWRNWGDKNAMWTVLATRLQPDSSEAWPQVQLSKFELSSEGLRASLTEAKPETILVHYVPHAYHPKGVPTWLPQALRQYKAAQSDVRVVVMFHELFAVSAPWKTAFWIAPFSISVLRGMCAVADAALTSNELYARQLKVYGGFKGTVRVQPVGANILPDFPIQPAASPASGAVRFAVFGMPNTRVDSLRRHRSLLGALIDQGAHLEITLLGAKSSGAEKMAMGTLMDSDRLTWVDSSGISDPEISVAMASCEFGLCNVEPKRAGKSGVMSAYCVHGVYPILLGASELVSESAPFLAYQSDQEAALAKRLIARDLPSGQAARVRNYADRCSWANAAHQFAEAIGRANQ